MLKENNENNSNLISIDELILRAKNRGVDFGKGNPKERLRYLTKIGLLPHAKRKSFNGQPPNGAYPEYVVELLVEIDEKLKLGKTIQELKREKERKELIETFSVYKSPFPASSSSAIYKTQFPFVQIKPSDKTEFQTEETSVIKKPWQFYYSSFTKIILIEKNFLIFRHYRY